MGTVKAGEGYEGGLFFLFPLVPLRCCPLQHLKRSQTSKCCNLQHLKRSKCCTLHYLTRSETSKPCNLQHLKRFDVAQSSCGSGLLVLWSSRVLLVPLIFSSPVIIPVRWTCGPTPASSNPLDVSKAVIACDKEKHHVITVSARCHLNCKWEGCSQHPPAFSKLSMLTVKRKPHVITLLAVR